jgi:uncharacterized repeat protein (TIGR03803 family)
MRGKRLPLRLRISLAIFTLTLAATVTCVASETVLHSFRPNGRDGTSPQAGLIADAAGNRYGTTNQGGKYNYGTVFVLSPNGRGGWTQKVLHNFWNNGTDGIYPYAALILDGAGNLYGTTSGGGDYFGGTVFEITPDGSGGWTEKKLYNFRNDGLDGTTPYGSLIFDAAGNLYGTTSQGGDYGSGTVFELTPNGSGGWTEKKLHNFSFFYGTTDGNSPQSSLIFDRAGNLYGTTSQGGDFKVGTVFELSPNGSGGWTETKLHSFRNNGADGTAPYGSLIFDAAGKLYGTTSQGGDFSVGTVFELAPNGSGGWTETKLHNFGLYGTDGANPNASLIFDAGGNLYGTTAGGGGQQAGIVFELMPNGSGGWTETKLHTFNNDGRDGAYPYGSLTLDGAGNLYSTTYFGGSFSGGTVFEISPVEGGGWNETVLYSFNFDGQDGASPYLANLVSDVAGNLYGTTGSGGAYNAGILFELTPDGGGGWIEKIVHNFKNNNLDGGYPYGKLIFDAAGNLYGTTLEGGPPPGNGTVYELSPAQGGGWNEKILHGFGNGTDGGFPFGGVIFDKFGNLYGTTYQGGDYGRGTVFEMTPNGSGGWIEKKLHNFNPNNNDGLGPFAGLVLDNSGNLYGTTGFGGHQQGGTVFEVSPNGSGGWTEKKLHNFNLAGDGFFPYAGLILDAANNLYGTTEAGGYYGQGIVFQLTPNGSGGWAEQVLHNFGNGFDGVLLQGGLVFDTAGNLYGTTNGGGDYGAGTVFELTPIQGGLWIETKLHNFFNNGTDGMNPQSGLIFDTSGSNLYGTTGAGGSYNFGTVFEITP